MTRSEKDQVVTAVTSTIGHNVRRGDFVVSRPANRPATEDGNIPAQARQPGPVTDVPGPGVGPSDGSAAGTPSAAAGAETDVPSLSAGPRDRGAFADDGQDDYAIVIGISTYPSIPSEWQAAPITDVPGTLFSNWLASPEGGALPREQITLLLSNTSSGVDDAGPTLGKLEDFFRTLIEKSSLERVGRRFYFYFSGYALSPHGTDSNNPLLLMADASPTNLGNHVATWEYLQLLRRIGAFEEIVFFLDCVELKASLQVPMRYPPWLVPGGAATQMATLLLCMHLTGGPSGVFTRALVEGLRGAAADDHGQVTISSLMNYLRQYPASGDLRPSYFMEGSQDLVLRPAQRPANPELQELAAEVGVEPAAAGPEAGPGRSREEPALPFLRLTRAQRDDLQRAILEAVSSYDELQMIARFRLDLNLNAISAEGSLRDVVFRLLEWAEANGRTAELLQALLQERPEHPGLQELAAQVGITPGNDFGSSTPA
jgi:hypothetical protein